MMQFRGISLVISVATVFLWFFPVPVIETLEAKPGGKGGKKPPPSEFVPMGMDYEDYFFRVSGEDGCLGEDDRWSGLLPGRWLLGNLLVSSLRWRVVKTILRPSRSWPPGVSGLWS